VFAGWVTNEDSLRTIKNIYEETGYVLDPHTAVAQTIAEKYSEKTNSNIPVIICATAHFAKFAKNVYRALVGEETEMDDFILLHTLQNLTKATIPDMLLKLQGKPIVHTQTIGNTKEKLENKIVQYSTISHKLSC